MRRACAEAGVGVRTFLRYRAAPEATDGRKGPLTAPKHKLSASERAEVVRIATSPAFRDLPVAQIVPTLADEGRYVASEATFRRILREEKLATRRGRVRAAKNKRPAPLVARAPGQVFVWDVTYLRAEVRGTFYYLYLFVDLFSRKVVGWTVENEQNDTHAARVLSATFDAEGRPPDLFVHADNGSAQKGATMLATMQRLGIAKSFSRPRVSDDNAYAEAMFRILKYVPWYPDRPFRSLDEARAWVKRFVHWYNHDHKHGSLRFVTPAQRHVGDDAALLAARHDVYQRARASSPRRWSGATRNWSRPGPVALNPVRLDHVPEFAMTPLGADDISCHLS